MLNLPEAPEEYDYGLKYALQHMNDEVGGGGDAKPPLKRRAPPPSPRPKGESNEISFPDDAFLMVTQGRSSIAGVAAIADLVDLATLESWPISEFESTSFKIVVDHVIHAT